MFVDSLACSLSVHVTVCVFGPCSITYYRTNYLRVQEKVVCFDRVCSNLSKGIEHVGLAHQHTLISYMSLRPTSSAINMGNASAHGHVGTLTESGPEFSCPYFYPKPRRRSHIAPWGNARRDQDFVRS